MKILFVHNEYAKFSGEEMILRGVSQLFKDNQHNVRLFLKKSSSIYKRGLRGKTRGFFEGIWSRNTAVELDREVNHFQPDVVQIQNIYPLISPSILPALQKRNIPILFSAHNYRLFCPTGLMLRDGGPCEKCALGHERWCVIHNCEGSMPRSMGYAIRNHVTRNRLLSAAHVITALNSFQREKFIKWGADPEKVLVVPNFVELPSKSENWIEPPQGEYVGYAGRIGPEKGIDVLLESAKRLPDVPFKIAGHSGRMPGIEKRLPSNVELVGELTPEKMEGFYRNSRFTVVPSVWYEGMPFSVVEAMLSGKAVIASDIGGLPDLVDEGITGKLFTAGSSGDLVKEISNLWDEPALSGKMGLAGRDKVMLLYNKDTYYNNLMEAFELAISRARRE